ncbi:serine/threonine protein kinase [Streptomyces agglomeratus]|uniref:class III lanthionine synthetase LanKC n=1 Tax=Streptomyces agglomeratus TaxID=285458 RepID=UPI0008549EDF|nr:class III lanthionine synthetase LanKC [Streptomyces agglomeratus]OEJ51390.1 serine/threonine protein kinase [Streptomyces agglomeratus]OEJ58791.1 serine/threonine protein kinase [Streptomyces agglomeratus]
MDNRYEVFCLADRQFYETPDRLSGSGAGSGSESGSGTSSSVPLFEAAQRELPPGWRRFVSGDWMHINPVDDKGAPLPGRPTQGWKIHVSACLDNAEKTAAKVWDYCVPRAVPFKFVPGPQPLHLRNSKYAGRGSSGKFVTVYPADENELHVILRELGELLDGEPGPYILTDLRWGDGPLYVRYGGFAHRYCVDGTGTLVPAIENPEGTLVPDLREPAFHVPDWVELPAFLEPHLAARNATTTNDLPYRIESALHFSNGGGVYLGEDLRSGEKVVLKEARPHAGLAADRADAVTRLERERAALERLSGLGVAPEVRDWFMLGDHRFLVMDHLPGRTLNSFFAQRHPLLEPEPDPAAVADYARWALRIHRAVEEAVAAVHGRGVVFNDLHMFNIMVGPDEESVRLLDFEAAARVEENHRQAIAHPGFIAPRERTGFDVDLYALACLRLALFLPMTTLLVVDRDKARHLADVAAAQFPDVPREFFDEAVAVICGTDAASDRPYVPVEPSDWPGGRDSVAAGILASATPARDDRIFPGDIAQFADGGGLGIAHGAAGVLHALGQAGAGRYEEGEEWLLRHTAPPPLGTPLGLYDGLTGVAHVLDGLGHRERALELVQRVLDEKWQRLVPGLYGGLAGVGLVLAELSRTSGETSLRQRALEAAQILADQRRPGSGSAGTGKRAGLLHGATGPALLFLRLYEDTGAPQLLDLAADALRADLARCVRNSTGTLLVDEGTRTMPYLGAGSVGIGMVLDDFLAHREDEEFEAARDGIVRAARSRYYAQPGLFNGRAGMALYLARTTAPQARPAHLAAQLDGLGWYALPYEGHLAFPGDQMMRLSMDLGTGGAGVLLALAAARGTGAHLPFLPPLRRP